MSEIRKLYCSKCRDLYGHHIALMRHGPEVMRRVTVTAQLGNGTYACRCECGHVWKSRSAEAAMIWSNRSAS